MCFTHFAQHSLLNNIRPNRPRPAGSIENIAAVAESVHEDRREFAERTEAARPSQATSLRSMGFKKVPRKSDVFEPNFV